MILLYVATPGHVQWPRRPGSCCDRLLAGHPGNPGSSVSKVYGLNQDLLGPGKWRRWVFAG